MSRSDGNRLPVQVRSRDASATLRPTTDDEVAPPQQHGRGAAVMGPILLLSLGLLLGIVNQTAREVSGVLRVPALIAALILVGQALMMFDQPAAEPSRDVVVLPDGDQVTVRVEGPPGRATYRETTQRVAGAVRENVTAARDTKLVIWLGLVLSVWLGLATLANPTAPWLLVLLSLLAAFLLFADAWRSLRGRR